MTLNNYEDDLAIHRMSEKEPKRRYQLMYGIVSEDVLSYELCKAKLGNVPTFWLVEPKQLEYFSPDQVRIIYASRYYLRPNIHELMSTVKLKELSCEMMDVKRSNIA